MGSLEVTVVVTKETDEYLKKSREDAVMDPMCSTPQGLECWNSPIVDPCGPFSMFLHR